MADLNALDSTAASSFEVDGVDFGDTASPVDQGPGDLPDPPPPPTETAIDDDFFDKAIDFGQSEPESEETLESQPTAAEPGEAEASAPEETSTDESEISIEVSRRDHKFKLDPEDADLRKTLRRGIKAPKLKAELDKTKEELAQFNSPDVQEKIKVWDELKGFAADGDFDRIGQAIAGDQWDAFIESKITEKLEYEEADPARRAEMDNQRLQREYDQKGRQRDKQIEDMKKADTERQEAATLDKWEGYGTPQLAKYGFSETEVSDPDRRFQLNEQLWETTWNAIEKHIKGDSSLVTPQLVARAFKKKASLMKYATSTIVEGAINKATEQKQEAAAATAASVATSKYPKTQAKAGNLNDTVDKWMKQTGGRKATDLLKFWP